MVGAVKPLSFFYALCVFFGYIYSPFPFPLPFLCCNFATEQPRKQYNFILESWTERYLAVSLLLWQYRLFCADAQGRRKWRVIVLPILHVIPPRKNRFALRWATTVITIRCWTTESRLSPRPTLHARSVCATPTSFAEKTETPSIWLLPTCAATTDGAAMTDWFFSKVPTSSTGPVLP